MTKKVFLIISTFITLNYTDYVYSLPILLARYVRHNENNTVKSTECIDIIGDFCPTSLSRTQESLTQQQNVTIPFLITLLSSLKGRQIIVEDEYPRDTDRTIPHITNHLRSNGSVKVRPVCKPQRSASILENKNMYIHCIEERHPSLPYLDNSNYSTHLNPNDGIYLGSVQQQLNDVVDQQESEVDFLTISLYQTLDLLFTVCTSPLPHRIIYTDITRAVRLNEHLEKLGFTKSFEKKPKKNIFSADFAETFIKNPEILLLEDLEKLEHYYPAKNSST